MKAAEVVTTTMPLEEVLKITSLRNQDPSAIFGIDMNKK